ncbi:MAG: hypothetical protein E4G94_00260 [ANME-2 cluster archaeon]|nr:MAG: hypothetical protein E4G94_00260 [ANME-2 cluster archaeon]
MSENFFQITLSIEPKSEGNAELVSPKVLHGLNYHFVIVKDGGDEGIIRIDEHDAVLKEVKGDKDCKELTAKQMKTLYKSYPAPKIKKIYRKRNQILGHGEVETAVEEFEVDEKGNRFIDTVQTVRSGFYLIDVPVLEQQAGA